MNKFYSHLIKRAQGGHGAHSPVATPATPATPAQPQPNPALQDGIVRQVSPRQAYSATYGPELTEAMRQRAEAYQKTHQADLQRASSDYGTLMPNYSTQYFNRPLTVLNDTSISHGGYAYPGVAAGPTFGSRMREAVSYLPFTRPAHDIAMRNGVADLNRGLPENTRRYNSTLIHEMNHALQELNEGDWNEALIPVPLMQPRLLPNESDDSSRYLMNYNYELPYSRYPIELAPVVAQAKMDYYEALKRGLNDPADAMNFDNPEAYQRFLEWMKDRPDYDPKTNNYGSSSDVKWILDLEPWERDLYFRGIASNQQQQPQGEKLAYTKPAPYDHYASRRMKRAARKDHNNNSGFLNEWKDAFEIARRLNSSSETSRQADTDSELDIWLDREFSKRPHLTHEEKLNALAEKLYLVNSALEGGAKRKPPSITQSAFDSPSWQG